MTHRVLRTGPAMALLRLLGTGADFHIAHDGVLAFPQENAPADAYEAYRATRRHGRAVDEMLDLHLDCDAARPSEPA